MRILTISLLIIVTCFLTSATDFPKENDAPSPLSIYSSEWNDARYLKCNTAAKANYMSASEKEVIYVLNLARTNPSLFASTVIKKYPQLGKPGMNTSSMYYKSLLDTMSGMKPVNLLLPDSLCFAGAQCHAINAGREGYVGHNRSKDDCLKKWYFNGECCDYGNSKPIDIVMALLIDFGVPSLGHREICLTDYKKIGVSIQPHSTYRTNAVLDFHY